MPSNNEDVVIIDISARFQDKTEPGVSNSRKKVDKFEESIKKTQKEIDKLNKMKCSVEMTAKDKALSVAKKTALQIKKLTLQSFSFVLLAKDKASKIIDSVKQKEKQLAGKTISITLKAVDLVTRPIRAILSGLNSALGLLGISAGVAGGIVIPLQMEAKQQNIETAFEVLLGSAEAAKQRVEELTTFAGSTPFTRDEIYESSRILQVFTGNALSTGDGLKMVGDIAAGTQQEFGDVALWIGRMYDAMKSGNKIGEMTSRLQEMGAINGEARKRLEKLAESGQDISKKWPKATKEFQKFDGMMEKMSGNLSNLFLGVKSFFNNNILKRMGTGLSNALTPALEKFREWRKENPETIQRMGDTIEKTVEQFTSSAIQKVEQLMGKVSDITSSQQFQNADFFGKIRILWDEIIANPFGEWWETDGLTWANDASSKIGKGLGSALEAGILTLLGVDPTGALEDGTSIGSSFADGFLEGFDAKKVLDAIVEKFKLMFKDAGTLLSDDPSSTSWFSALVLGFLFKKLGGFKLLGGLGKGAGWLGKKIFSGSGKDGTGLPVEGGQGKSYGSFNTETMNVTANVVNVNGKTSGSGSGGGGDGKSVADTAKKALQGAAAKKAIQKSIEVGGQKGLDAATRKGIGSVAEKSLQTGANSLMTDAAGVYAGYDWTMGIGYGVLALGALGIIDEMKTRYTAGKTQEETVDNYREFLEKKSEGKDVIWYAGNHRQGVAGNYIESENGMDKALIQKKADYSKDKSVYTYGYGDTGEELKAAPPEAPKSELISNLGVLPGELEFGKKLDTYAKDAVKNVERSKQNFFEAQSKYLIWSSKQDGIGKLLEYQTWKKDQDYYSAAGRHFDSTGEWLTYEDWEQEKDSWKFGSSKVPISDPRYIGPKTLAQQVQSDKEFVGPIYTVSSQIKKETEDIETMCNSIPVNVGNEAASSIDQVMKNQRFGQNNFDQGVFTRDSFSGKPLEGKPFSEQPFSSNCFANATLPTLKVNWSANVPAGTPTVNQTWNQLAGKETAQSNSSYGPTLPGWAKHADGDITSTPHVGLVAEDGAEAIIPLSAKRRSRGLSLWERAGRMLGVRPYADGGFAGREAPASYAGSLAQAVESPITVSIAGVTFEINTNSADPKAILEAIKSNAPVVTNLLAAQLAASLQQVFSNTPRRSEGL